MNVRYVNNAIGAIRYSTLLQSTAIAQSACVLIEWFVFHAPYVCMRIADLPGRPDKMGHFCNDHIQTIVNGSLFHKVTTI